MVDVVVAEIGVEVRSVTTNQADHEKGYSSQHRKDEKKEKKD